MNLKRNACLAAFAALGAWSLAACSSDNAATTTDGGSSTGGGSSDTGGSAGKGTGGASNGGSAGKATGGTAGTAGSAGAGTGGAQSVDGGFDGGEPSVKITAPKDLTKVGPGAAFPDYPDVPISFVVANFAMAAPGTPVAMCPLATCGHVHINVDGVDCNDKASGFPYNVAGIASPLAIGLDYCIGGIAGVHTVTISLHDTMHGAIKVAGKAVEDSITITAAPEGDGGTLKDGGSPDSGGAKDGG